MKFFAIIVAGGSGQRMGASVPKQFLSMNDEIILMKSISAFYKYDSSLQIVVALPESQFSYWESLCKKHNFDIDHSLVNGGETRFHSVKNAIKLIEGNGVVAVHDGVRPLVSQNTIKQVFEMASINGNAIPYIDVVDSIRLVELGGNLPLDRNNYKLIQTPQAFECSLFKKAYEQEWDDSFTDDASVVEKLGIKINLVPGNLENIKITTQIDLSIAETLSDYLIE